MDASDNAAEVMVERRPTNTQPASGDGDRDKTWVYVWYAAGFLVAPGLWLFLCWYGRLFSTEELLAVALAPQLGAFVIIFMGSPCISSSGSWGSSAPTWTHQLNRISLVPRALPREFL